MAPRCHYEVLGVAQSASAEEIRSSYRKLALLWHPDKNPHRVEEATRQFRDIQSAYEVLSDKNEREWYDGHRESILRGGNPDDFSDASQSHRPADEINLWSYFSTSVFSGYGNSEGSFYGVYGKVFRDLAGQEWEAARKEGRKIHAGAPDLGYADSPYSQVAAFYNYWLSFSSEKSFSWCDEYNLAAAPNRQIRRRMEEENKKLRKKEKKEFNEIVRNLAAFVKKRDKRVQEYQIKLQKEQKEREEETKKKKKMEAELRAQRASAFVEQEWSRREEDEDHDAFYEWDLNENEKDKKKKRNPKKELEEEEKKKEDAQGLAEDEEEEEEEVSEFYCIVCSKKFKSQMQWRNHEKSKKHLEKVNALRESLQEEDDYLKVVGSEGEHELGNNEDNVANGNSFDQVDDLHDHEENLHEMEKEDNGDEEDDDNEEEEEEILLMRMMKVQHSKQKQSDLNPMSTSTRRKNKNGINGSNEKLDDATDEMTTLHIDDKSDYGSVQEVERCEPSSGTKDRNRRQEKLKKKHNNLKKKQEMFYGEIMGDDLGKDEEQNMGGRIGGRGQGFDGEVNHTSIHGKDIDEAELLDQGIRLNSEGNVFGGGEVDGGASFDEENESVTHESDANLMTNAEERKTERRMNGNVAMEHDGSRRRVYENFDVIDKKKKKGKDRKAKSNSENSCAVCEENFSSRNLLFKHISTSGHAIPRGSK